MTDTSQPANDASAALHEPAPTNEPVESSQQHRSPLSKIADAVKKPFHHEKEEPSPALQEAIHNMEDRRERVKDDMEREGKDTSLLSGKRIDQVRNPLRG